MPLVPIERIKIGLNRRKIKQDKVDKLMESIETSGLLNPITIDGDFNLIAGLHRLTAFKQLGLEKINCNIVNYLTAHHARLAEIDENLIRNELKPLERSQLWLEREQLLDNLGLRAKAGDNQYTRNGHSSRNHSCPNNNGNGGEMVTRPPKTTQELAKEVGYSERSFQLGKQIAKDITPAIQELIKDTPLAESTTELVKIARVGSKERVSAQKAEHASQLAQAKGLQQEAEEQAQIAIEFRAKQQELQMKALESAIAQREAKLVLKKTQASSSSEFCDSLTPTVMKKGEKWYLGRHLVYCGDTTSKEFINLLPANADLAIGSPSEYWEHDYLVDKARIVAVLRSMGTVYNFCKCQQMPFQYELIIGNLYVGIFSRESIPKPQTPINIDGVEGIVNYLLHVYTNPNSFVIAQFIGYGEVLVACERLKRICFTGDINSQSVNRSIARWQNLRE
ncbi:MAG: ParB N-terminal domain-containing protein [Scytonematopsis contorta HA4267-MV1]|jgi:ParB family chromosome partitioning protein|nr:ParB N-terminal domain-containing protein [Scytonematopsis contorta HA4267-MV1]